MVDSLELVYFTNSPGTSLNLADNTTQIAKWAVISENKHLVACEATQEKVNENEISTHKYPQGQVIKTP